VWALVELGDPEAIDLFLHEKDAERALGECLRDEPDWAGTLFVAPIELDDRGVLVELSGRKRGTAGAASASPPTAMP
jgi:hypothetical protein